MAVYAPVPAFADRRRHPRALTLIIAGHALVIAAVMSARMELPQKLFEPPPVVQSFPVPKEPPPQPEPQPQPEPRTSTLDNPVVIVPIPTPPRPDVDRTPVPLPPPQPGDLIGPRIEPVVPQPPIKADPVRTGPRFATPPHSVRPAYPPSKLDSGEEATLRLRLTIDERGRVTAVEPVGAADRAFLEAARRHILAHWRYQPATEDGRAISSTTVITLRFELND